MYEPTVLKLLVELGLVELAAAPDGETGVTSCLRDRAMDVPPFRFLIVGNGSEQAFGESWDTVFEMRAIAMTLLGRVSLPRSCPPALSFRTLRDRNCR